MHVYLHSPCHIVLEAHDNAHRLNDYNHCKQRLPLDLHLAAAKVVQEGELKWIYDEAHRDSLRNVFAPARESSAAAPREPSGAAILDFVHGSDEPAVHWCALLGDAHHGPRASLTACFSCTVQKVEWDRAACNELLLRDTLHFRLAGHGATVTGNSLRRGF